MNEIAKIQVAIRELHGCESRHESTVPVTETFNGEIVWDGFVETFSLVGHPTAKRCYAWTYRQDDGRNRYLAVLEVPPIGSAPEAVRAAIVADFKQR